MPHHRTNSELLPITSAIIVFAIVSFLMDINTATEHRDEWVVTFVPPPFQAVYASCLPRIRGSSLDTRTLVTPHP